MKSAARYVSFYREGKSIAALAAAEERTIYSYKVLPTYVHPHCEKFQTSGSSRHGLEPVSIGLNCLHIVPGNFAIFPLCILLHFWLCLQYFPCCEATSTLVYRNRHD